MTAARETPAHLTAWAVGRHLDSWVSACGMEPGTLRDTQAYESHLAYERVWEAV